MRKFFGLILIVAGPSLGCSSDGGDDGNNTAADVGETGMEGTGGEESRPADASADAIEQFLNDQGYREDGWAAETDAPREAADQVSPHGRVRVWINDVLDMSQDAGNQGSEHVPWSMTVKELYDDGDQIVGHAVMFNAIEGNDPVWTYYCWGPEGRCGTGEPAYTMEEPSYGQGFDVSCGSCHAGNVFTQLP